MQYLVIKYIASDVDRNIIVCTTLNHKKSNNFNFHTLTSENDILKQKTVLHQWKLCECTSIEMSKVDVSLN